MGQLLNLPREYKLIDGYIYAAKSESTRLECPNCDQENQIYRINKEFIYSYKYVDVNQKAFRFKLLENGNWEFVDATSNGSNVIIDVALLVLPDGEHFKKSSYCQTKIGFKLLENQCNHPTTGLIENQKNIWLHPPRELLFKVLELNPFPYIKAPFQIGTEWKWELNIGPQWADKRWKIWTNEIHNNYRYKITATTLLKTKLGILKCFVIDGVAKSELGEDTPEKLL